MRYRNRAKRGKPQRLLEAMRHAATGGKRLRPFLVVESAALFDANEQAALATGAALECIHCYSLVHDDLPAMDDDDLRRGRPTTHRAFDEATAILTGDALQTLAFELLAQLDSDAETRIALVALFARAAGVSGMAGGQMLDLEAEGRFAPDKQPLSLTLAEIKNLQAMKTGALLSAACEAGVILGRAGPDKRRALADYSKSLGLAFQIADDLLDAEGDAATLGKAAAKDAGRGKATLVSALGVCARARTSRKFDRRSHCGARPLWRARGDADCLREVYCGARALSAIPRPVATRHQSAARRNPRPSA
jgi:farnesyl diphosphate synthase